MLKLNQNYSDYTDETDVNYPEGKAVNASASESYDGTPLLAEFMNDVNAAHIAMYEKAYGSRDGINGQADTQKASQFADSVAKYTDDKVKKHADERGLTDGVHGATSEATAGQIVSRDEFGRAKVAAPVADNDIANRKWVLEAVYPIGSLYWSSNDKDPSTLFGGTWTQIKDTFILSAGDTYKNNDIGGSATVTLTVNQIPSHTHTIKHTHSFTTSSDGSHNHRALVYTGEARQGIGYMYAYNTDAGDIGSYWCIAGQSAADPWDGSDDISVTKAKDSKSAGYARYANWGAKRNNSYKREIIEAGGSHTHKGTTAEASVNNTGGTGSSQSHNNMPPYVVKYCWERIA